MASPDKHALSSAKRWGGKASDYLEIHKKMDCSKTQFPDNRHRALTHTMFWVEHVMIELFGDTIKNSDGKDISVKDICELHILEDYHMKFIPTVSDFFQEMEMKSWMQNGMGEVAPSAKKRFKNGADEGTRKKVSIEYKD